MAVESEFIEVIQTLLAAVTSKEEQRVAVNYACMEVARRGHLSGRPDRRPGPGAHPELVEIIHPMHSVIATKEVDRAIMSRPGRTTPSGWNEALHLRRVPRPSLKVKVEHVIQPGRAIITAKDVHEVTVHGRDVAKSSRRHAALVARRYCLPSAGVKVEAVEIVQPGKARVAPEQIHLVAVDNSTVVLTTCWYCTLDFKSGPVPRWKVEAVDVV
mmetsp:Transcript_60717/g.142021  ORF Transcript_60717/g.142021 Transcript_60717/m.142021 type:complete len:214 (+) Transcript_60717:747-1388(+)